MELTNEQKLHAQVISKAWEDSQFKKDLITNPVNAIEQLTGIKLNLPQGQKLVVVDQTDETTAFLNIPRKLDIDEMELSDEQLELVSGGTLPYFTIQVAGAIWTACAAAGTAVGTAIANYQNRQDAAAAAAKK